MAGKKQFEGGVFAESIAGGRSGARVDVLADSLRAETPAGEVFDLSYANMELELGGASGRMLFCRNPARSVTIFCEERGFIFALTSLAGQHIQDKMAPVRGQLRGLILRRAGIAALLATMFALLYFGVPPLIRWSLEAAVVRVPYSLDEKLGAAAINNMDLGGPELHDAVLTHAVETIVARLAPHVGLKDATFHVRVVRRDTINAFALPGGYMVVYTGLLADASQPEQVAGVLAHEMAHVVHRHGIQRIAQSLGIVATVQLMFGDIGGILAVGKELLGIAAVNHYSRAAENQADATAVRILNEAAISPLALAEFFKIMQKDENTQTITATMPEWASTHPDLNARINAITDAMRGLPATPVEPLAVNWKTVQETLHNLPETPPTHAN